MSTHGRGRPAGTLIGSTARDIIERGREPVVVAGPLVVDPDPEDETATPPLEVDRLIACVDGTGASERGLPIAAAWADALSMKLTIVTVAEPCPPPVRIGAPWRRRYGPNEDADEYVRRLGEQWALDVPGLDTIVVYDPIGAATGSRAWCSARRRPRSSTYRPHPPSLLRTATATVFTDCNPSTRILDTVQTSTCQEGDFGTCEGSVKRTCQPDRIAPSTE